LLTELFTGFVDLRTCGFPEKRGRFLGAGKQKNPGQIRRMRQDKREQNRESAIKGQASLAVWASGS
jgi:hypothetical protein